MPAAKGRTIPAVKRTTPAERAEECHAEQIRLKEEAAQRRAAAAEKATGKAR